MEFISIWISEFIQNSFVVSDFFVWQRHFTSTISKQPCWLIVSCHYSYAMYLTHLDTVYQSCHSVYHHFSLLNNIFKKQHFYKQHQAEIDKKSSTKIRQHHEAERFLFEKFYLKNCLFSLFTLLFKNDRKLSKKCAKKTSASVLMRLCD